MSVHHVYEQQQECAGSAHHVEYSSGHSAAVNNLISMTNVVKSVLDGSTNYTIQRLLRVPSLALYCVMLVH
jgi:hypothetical protein